MALGVAFGSAIGFATDNIALWVPVGIALGIGIGSRFDRTEKRDREQEY